MEFLGTYQEITEVKIKIKDCYLIKDVDMLIRQMGKMIFQVAAQRIFSAKYKCISVPYPKDLQISIDDCRGQNYDYGSNLISRFTCDGNAVHFCR